MSATLAELRNRAGQTQTALDAFELDHGCRPKPGPVLEAHNDLLRRNIVNTRELRIREAQLTGQMNFTPRAQNK